MKTRVERVLQVLLIALLLLVAGYIGVSYSRGSLILPRAASAERAPVSTSEPVVRPAQYTAHGRVVPYANASLSFPTSGILAELLVEAGDRVVAGQPIARLAASQQKAEVAAATGELRRAHAQLEDVKAGPSTAEIKVAEASLEVARAAAAQAPSGPQPQDVAAAEAAVAAARVALLEAKQGNNPAGLDTTDAALEQTDLVPGVATPMPYFLSGGANRAAVASAEAQLARAVAELNQIKAAASGSDKAAAEAQVSLAQAQLELKQSPARPQAIAAAEANVDIAQAALERAQAQLAAMELRAPFTGTVVAVLARLGEHVAQGVPVAQLGDLGRWRIETTDLTERDVTRVHVGDRATVTFNALPGAALEGTVTSVTAAGQAQQVGTIYTVYVSLNQQDGRLNWNMTALVAFHEQ